jgi:hypothetical protein
MLQCTVLRCNVPCCVATWSAALQRGELCCSMPYRGVAHRTPGCWCSALRNARCKRVVLALPALGRPMLSRADAGADRNQAADGSDSASDRRSDHSGADVAAHRSEHVPSAADLLLGGAAGRLGRRRPTGERASDDRVGARARRGGGACVRVQRAAAVGGANPARRYDHRQHAAVRSVCRPCHLRSRSSRTGPGRGSHAHALSVTVACERTSRLGHGPADRPAAWVHFGRAPRRRPWPSPQPLAGS